MSTVTQSAMRSPTTAEPPDRLHHILGDQANVTFADGETVVEPRNEDACARTLAACSANGWRATVSGSGHWLPQRPPSIVRISTGQMDAITDVRPADFYATVQAGVNTDKLANELMSQGVWLPIDPPGAQRTVGSLLGCATQGGLRTGFGGVRDHVLGLTVITGSGRVLRLGGRVVKNVAGFDIAKLVIGGFGAYGIVTAAHVKLRAQPTCDATVQIRGDRFHLLEVAAVILAAGMTPAALQLSTDASAQTLTVRSVGSGDLVDAEVAGVRRACGEAVDQLSVEDADTWWSARRAAVVAAPVTVRIGTTSTGVARALEISDDYAGTRAVTFGFGGATLRWNGEADTPDLLRMRELAAKEGMPLVVERAPGRILAAVGHYGRLPEGSARLAPALQKVFDPAGVLSGALWGT